MSGLINRFRAFTKWDWIGFLSTFVFIAYYILKYIDTPTWDSIVRIGFFVAFLILMLVRKPPVTVDTSPLALSLPLFHLSLLALFQIEGPAIAPSVGLALVTGSLVFTIMAWFALGKSFGVIPAVRVVRTTGPYRLIRHPIYFSYILTGLGAVFMVGPVWNWIWLFLYAAGFVGRIHLEEKILFATSPEYLAYAERVKYRLLPGVY